MFDNIVAKEGHKKIFVAFLAFIFFVLLECGFFALLSFVTFLFLIYIYRYKYIDIKALEKDKLYAPISGTISAIDVQNFNKIIYIDVSLCDSHILRSLQKGEVKSSLKRGINLSLNSLKSKKLNEKANLEYKDAQMQLFSSLCNDTIVLPEKQIYEKGEKIGSFLHGQVVIRLSENYSTYVTIGQKVESGQSIIAQVNK